MVKILLLKFSSIAYSLTNKDLSFRQNFDIDVFQSSIELAIEDLQQLLRMTKKVRLSVEFGKLSKNLKGEMKMSKNECWESFRKNYQENKNKVSSKLKLINIEKCPYWDSDNACWDCPRFDKAEGRKEICPFHKDQTFLSQQSALYLLNKIHLNSEFGKLAKGLKGEK